jgi:hypothetical protein
MRSSLIVVSVMFSLSTVEAQQVDLFLGAGSAHAGSNGQSFDTFGDGTKYPATSLGGVFTDFGANVFFNNQVGLGWTVSFRSAHDYAGLAYRPSFNTFDAIYQPMRLRTKRSRPEFRAGLGIATVHFDFDDPASCDQAPGCPSSHYFLVNMAAATRVYVTSHVFVRPAVEVHYVNNFFLFGSNWVPQYSVSVGYSFGKRE